jgi:FlaG/FlaF family flagellin (archaellin)
VVLKDVFPGLSMQAVVSVVGIALLIAATTVLGTVPAFFSGRNRCTRMQTSRGSCL